MPTAGRRRRQPRRSRASAGGADASAAARRPRPLVGETAERDVRVETRDVIAVFTNRGARLKSWRLKHYLDQQQAAAGARRARRSPTQPLPFTLRDGRRRRRPRRSTARCTRSAARRRGADRRRRSICGSNTATAPAFTRSRNSTSSPTSYIVDVPRRRSPTAIEPIAADDRVGPGASATSAEVEPLRAEGRRAALPDGGKVAAARGEGHREAADATRAISSTPASTTTTS